MARAHPEQHIPIQFTLHRDHPLFRFLEQERVRLGQSRASYVRWLLEQQFLRSQGVTMGATAVPPSASVASSMVMDETVRTVSPPEPPALEPDDDLLASFLA